MIDVTSGQVPASVVGTSACFNRAISNQWVDTNPEDASADEWEFRVWEYDLILTRIFH